MILKYLVGAGIWIGLSYAVGHFWKSKGHDDTAGTVVSILLSPLIGFIIGVCLARDAKGVEKHTLATGEMKKCPFCAELIKTEARVCRYCGRDLANPHPPA